MLPTGSQPERPAEGSAGRRALLRHVESAPSPRPSGRPDRDATGRRSRIDHRSLRRGLSDRARPARCRAAQLSRPPLPTRARIAPRRPPRPRTGPTSGPHRERASGPGSRRARSPRRLWYVGPACWEPRDPAPLVGGLFATMGATTGPSRLDLGWIVLEEKVYRRPPEPRLGVAPRADAGNRGAAVPAQLLRPSRTARPLPHGEVQATLGSEAVV